MENRPSSVILPAMVIFFSCSFAICCLVIFCFFLFLISALGVQVKFMFIFIDVVSVHFGYQKLASGFLG